MSRDRAPLIARPREYSIQDPRSVTTVLPPDSDHLSALRLLCEFVYQPTDPRRAAVMAVDWSGLPGIHKPLAELRPPVTSSALSEQILKIIQEAVVDLEPRFPARPDSITPLEVVRLHILDRQPWPSIEAMLREEGRPFSRGTLIRRQHEFLPYLEEWGAKGVEGAAEVKLARSADRPGRAGRSRLILAAIVAAMAVLAFGWLTPKSATELSNPVSARLIPPMLEGRQIVNFRNGLPLPESFPRFDLPPFDESGIQRVRAMVIEREYGAPRILFSYQKAADQAAQFCLWDPVAREMKWELRFDPPPDERLTHSGVGDEVRSECYWSLMMYHAGPEGDLGEYAVAVLVQKYSPTFVIYLNLDTGMVDGYYVTPGQSLSGLVIDLGRDGRRELLLGAQDNFLDRPALIALRPGPGVSAASTVAWNLEAKEGALCRVILPAPDGAAEALEVTRLAIVELGAASFDPFSRVLSVGVGTGRSSIYHARFGPGLRPTGIKPVLYWDTDSVSHRELNLVLPPIGEWENDFEYIEGTESWEGMRPALVEG